MNTYVKIDPFVLHSRCTFVTAWTGHNRRVWVSFLNYLEKSDRNISGAYCKTWACFIHYTLCIYVKIKAVMSKWRSFVIKVHLTINKLQFVEKEDCRPQIFNNNFGFWVFKRIFFNENVWISIKISLKFVPNGPINNITALVQIMAWRCSGDKPLSEPMMVSLPTHICVTRPQLINVWNM